MRTPMIAGAYRRILEEAEAAGGDRERQIEAAHHAFYKGFVAEAIDRHCATFEAMDGTGRRHRGLLSGEDLAGWQATYDEPASLSYRGLQVHKTGPWGQGPAMLEALALMEGFDVASMAPDGAEFVHTVVECIKLAFADRDVFFGDPDFVDVPLDTLLSPAYAGERRKLVGTDASNEIRPGRMGDSDAILDAILALSGSEETTGIGAGEPTFIDLPEVEGDTVHLDVVDRFGNLVSATPSGGWLQSSPAIPGLGFNLSTRGQMFWLDPRIPSALGPRRRPRTTLTPTLVTRDGRPWLGLGSPGGDQQDQWTLATLLRHVDHRMNIQAAIDAPLFHSRHLVGSFFPREIHRRTVLIEGRFRPDVLAELRERGHALSVQEDWALGRLCAAGYSRGMVRAAATPRFMQAYAIGR
jgi:gamma-glutamyltranspeptidase/glutathione hydrolase